ncbi:hypothetical protein LZ30DRAFT_294505 [Colletotrichum cereale]|nr:hypothetical protein LZ30DRAFT_294505 [Colletotrichum cereale]
MSCGGRQPQHTQPKPANPNRWSLAPPASPSLAFVASSTGMYRLAKGPAHHIADSPSQLSGLCRGVPAPSHIHPTRTTLSPLRAPGRFRTNGFAIMYEYTVMYCLTPRQGGRDLFPPLQSQSRR